RGGARPGGAAGGGARGASRAAGAGVVRPPVPAPRASGPPAPANGRAAAPRRSVDAALTGTATIEPVSQAKLAFPIGGTVAAVNVKVGDPVTVGQSLASLDPASLLSDLAGKQQALAQAQLTLDNALSGQSTSTARGVGGARPSVATRAAGGWSPGGRLGVVIPEQHPVVGPRRGHADVPGRGRAAKRPADGVGGPSRRPRRQRDRGQRVSPRYRDVRAD